MVIRTIRRLCKKTSAPYCCPCLHPTFFTFTFLKGLWWWRGWWGWGPQAREWLCKARRHEATLRFCCAHSTVNWEQSLFNSAQYSELGTGHSAQNPFWKSKTPLRPLDDGSPLSLGGPSPLLLITPFIFLLPHNTLLLNIWGTYCYFLTILLLIPDAILLLVVNLLIIFVIGFLLILLVNFLTISSLRPLWDLPFLCILCLSSYSW